MSEGLKGTSREFSIPSSQSNLVHNQGRLAPWLVLLKPQNRWGLRLELFWLTLGYCTGIKGEFLITLWHTGVNVSFPSTLIQPHMRYWQLPVQREVHTFPLADFCTPSLLPWQIHHHIPRSLFPFLPPIPHPLHLASLHRNSLPFMVFLDKDILPGRLTLIICLTVIESFD